MASTQLSDLIIPEVFSGYVQQITEEKSRLIQSGAVVRSSFLDNFLAGPGKTIEVPEYDDLDSSDATGEENTPTDAQADIMAATAPAANDFPRNDAVPAKISSVQETAVRVSRNKAWSTASLARHLTGSDPLRAVANRVAGYWLRRSQRQLIHTVSGIFADNDAAPSGIDRHVQGDLTHDIKGGSFVDGTTNFSANAFLAALLTMGDAQEDLTMMMTHSVVFNRMQNLNLIDFVEQSDGKVRIPTYLGREVIVDDGMPNSGGVYETWLFGTGAIQLGLGSPDNPSEVVREGLAGNGGGQDILISRIMNSMHPTGHAYIQGAIANGGPANSELASAANWGRVYAERKMIKLGRLVTREA